MFLISLLIIFSPLIGSILLLFLQNKSKSKTTFIANFSIAISAVLSFALLIFFLINPDVVNNYKLYTWLSTEQSVFNISIIIDSLSIFMSFIVSTVSLLVHVYSVGYMNKESSYNRFFAYTTFFTFSMLLIIFANNFLQLFIGWELVGLSSYLLIGFWTNKETAIKANLKAFIVNRIGDIGLILGVCLIFAHVGSLDYKDLFLSLPELSQKTISIVGVHVSLISLIAFLLFLGAAAKSAQIPLQFWLPDSMEGPTPISALIHAATMVTAGIYMIARLSPFFEQSLYVLDIILFIGCLTAISMGLVALVQNDIKRIIAYSTISQLGYMMAALGASYYSLAIFHLMTHAFFKALLFLCAGSIILKCNHEQDINKISGLKNILPITYSAFLLASLSLIGFPLTSGFFSKDMIIEALKYNGNINSYYILSFSIFITTLYTLKILIKVFFGEQKEKASSELEHDNPIIVPIVLLVIPSIFIGLFFIGPIINDQFFTTSLIDTPKTNLFYETIVINPILFSVHSLTSSSFYILILGVLFSYFFYFKKAKFLILISEKLSFTKNILLSEYGFNNLSNIIIPHYFKRFGNFVWNKADKIIIDDVFVNGIGRIINRFSIKIRSLQTGFLYHYAFTMIVSLIIFLLVFYDY
tara:strand:- start:52821 stop:54743 length:1923 start_codon:yes stop_codon:yes gene_type:complete